MGGKTTHGDVVKSDLTQDELETVYYFIKRFFLGLLKKIDQDELLYYVKNNKAPDISLYITMLPKKIRQKAKEVVKQNTHLVEKYLNADYISRYIKDSLTEFNGIFETPKGEKWLKGFVRYLQKTIKSL